MLFNKVVDNQALRPNWINTLLLTNDVTEKIRILKKSSPQLRENNTTTACSLDILIDLYLCAENGSSLRKCMQGIFDGFKGCVKDCFLQRVDKCVDKIINITTDTFNNAAALKQSLDKMCTITDQLPWGEDIISDKIKSVVQFIKEVLSVSHNHSINCQTAHEAAVEMHICLHTLLLINKIMQKLPVQNKLGLMQENALLANLKKTDCLNDEILGNMFDEILIVANPINTGSISCDYDNTKESSKQCLDESLHESFFVIASVVWKILFRESVEVDCQVASGICFGAILQLLLDSKQITDSLISDKQCFTISLCDKTVTYNLSVLPMSSKFSIYGGLLATLNSKDLSQFSEREEFLLEHVGLTVMKLTERMDDGKSRLAASRCIAILSNRLIDCVQSSFKTSALVQRLLGSERLLQAVVTYVFLNWDDSIDVVRHNVNSVFRNLISCHLLASGENPKESSFLATLADKLLVVPWHQKGKYEPLTTLVKVIGSRILLLREPSLSNILLSTMAESALAVHVAYIFEFLPRSHWQELVAASMTASEVLKAWSEVWVQPVCNVLGSSSCTAIKYSNITQLVLPRLLKNCPDCLTVFINLLHVHNVGPLVTVLKAARSADILEKIVGLYSDSDYWQGLVPVSSLQLAIGSLSEKVRTDVLALLCENAKLSETIEECDLSLVRYFLENNMYSQSPSFRQHMVALYKKLFIRLRESGHALLKNYQLLRQRGANAAEVGNSLKLYREFFLWLMSFLFNHLHPGICFPASTTALSLLATLTKVFIEGQLDGEGLLFHPSLCMTGARLNTLLFCLTHNYETNKSDCLYVIRTLCINCGFLQAEQLKLLLFCCLNLSSTTRPQDGSTAAHLLQVALEEESSYEILVHYMQTEKIDNIRQILLNNTLQIHAIDVEATSCDCNATEKSIRSINSDYRFTIEDYQKISNGSDSRFLLAVCILLNHLDHQVKIANDSLLQAAGSKPIYPTIHCIRHLLENYDLELVVKSCNMLMWQNIIAILVDMCLQIAQLVAPVVAHCSPEGNIVMDPDANETSVDEAISVGYDGDALNNESAAVKVVRMPEFLTVCGWRCVKEVSLLLGYLVESAPVIDIATASPGLLTINQVKTVGKFFTNQLTDARHRGAFELAYAGFVKVTARLWRSPVVGLAALPQQWLDEIIADISSEEMNAKLCSTRRSAGVPFLIQAILGTEPHCTGLNCFHRIMKLLLNMATTVTQPTSSATTQVHALNILRALFRDTRLGSSVTEYVSHGLQAAIMGQSSELWAIRNSATLLFNSLIVRMFGVKRSKDELARNNSLTGSTLFHRYPSLYEFLLNQMVLGSADHQKHQLSPALYTALTVLSRLTSSTSDIVNTNCSLHSFLPHVMRCAVSPIYKVRVMAAHALRPLLTSDNILSIHNNLFSQLSTTKNQNFIHGILLQLHQLLGESVYLFSDVQQNIREKSLDYINSSLWLLEYNPCYVTRTAYVDICCDVINLAIFTRSTLTINLLANKLLQQVYYELAENVAHTTPGYAIYCESLCKNLLGLLLFEQVLNKPVLFEESLKLISLGLQNKLYEVRLVTLDFLIALYGSSKKDENELFSLEDQPDFVAVIGNDKNAINISVKNSLLEYLDKQENIWTSIIDMLSSDSHALCIAKVIQVLTAFLANNLNFLQHPLPIHTVIPVLMKLCSHSVDVVSYSALECLSLLLSQLISTKDQQSDSVLFTMCKLIDEMSTSKNAVEFRLAAAYALLHNIDIFLLDSSHLLGANVFAMWTVLLRFHYDEELRVRTVAADISVRLQHGNIEQKSIERKENLENQPNVKESCVLSTVSVQNTLTAFVSYWSDKNWIGCLDTMLLWLHDEIEPDWLNQKGEVRLFDKGELNTYRDDMNLVRRVAEKIKHFLTSTVYSIECATRLPQTATKSLNSIESVQMCNENITQQSTLIITEMKDRRQNVVKQAKILLDETVKGIPAVGETEGFAFVKQDVYSQLVETIYRQLIALHCLTLVIDNQSQLHNDWLSTLTVVRETINKPFVLNCLLEEVLSLCAGAAM